MRDQHERLKTLLLDCELTPHQGSHGETGHVGEGEEEAEGDAFSGRGKGRGREGRGGMAMFSSLSSLGRQRRVEGGGGGQKASVSRHFLSENGRLARGDHGRGAERKGGEDEQQQGEREISSSRKASGSAGVRSSSPSSFQVKKEGGKSGK